MRQVPLYLSIFTFLLFLIAPVFSSPLAVIRPSETRDAIVAAAQSYEGSPYVYGGITASGFDCSGLVYRIFLQETGQAVPRTAYGLYLWAEPIRLLDIQPGDLLFFNTTGTISHVGIFIGDNRFIHSASEGPETGVIVSSLDEPYWKKRFAGAGRVLPASNFRGIYVSNAVLGLLGPSTNPTLLYGFGELLSISMDIPVGTAKIRPGIGVLFNWNYYSGSVLLSGLVTFGLSSQFAVFAGWPVIAGLAWEPLSLRLKKGPLRGGTLSIIGMGTLSASDGSGTEPLVQGTLSVGIKYTLGF